MVRLLRRLCVAVAIGAGAAFAAGCGAAGDGSATRAVLIDYQHDEVASSFLSYFPQDVRVRPGDTVVFRQEWTGEPHSVTMGTAVDQMMEIARPLMERYPVEEPPEEEFRPFLEVYERLPMTLNDNLEVNQNGAQPCYLDRGLPPRDPDTPCTDEQQEQPAFNGRQSYYNSGFIPYQGEQGNTFTVPLSDDIEPGTYSYYCNIHGPFHSGTITVVPPDAEIPSQDEVARQARAEINEQAEPLLAAFERVQRETEPSVMGMTVRKPIAGWFTPQAGHAIIDEFVPRRIEVGAGESVTWAFVGAHTVSFDVPDYFAQIVVEDDGTVVFSEDARLPRGGPGYPRQEPPSDGGGGGSGAPEDDASPTAGGAGAPQDDASPAAGTAGDGPPGSAPPSPIVVDAGEWDGTGFLSSGIFADGSYKVTFTRPGVYNYACLIHPQMVGQVVVN